MADPITLATIAIVGTAVSGATAAAGAAYTGYANSQSYKYQAGVAAVNQKIAQQNAEYSRAVGEVQAERSGMKTRQQIGQTIAAQGSSGFRADEGSGSDVLSSEHMLGESEQNTIRSNAAKAAYGHEVEAINFGAQSELDRMASRSSMISGGINATSSLLGSASSTSSKWLQYQDYFG
jgi:hypothetical protein